MSYGTSYPARCPECGWGADFLTVVSYDFDPPPIPMRVPPAVFVEDRQVGFCGGCDVELDPEAMLAAVAVVRPLITPLVEPVALTPERDAIENAELMIEESIADVRALMAGKRAARPSHLGDDYDHGYAQGRKDACRVILIALGSENTTSSADQ